MRQSGNNLHAQLSKLALKPSELATIMSPALAIYPDSIDANITAMQALLGGDLRRWQPHVKTSKLAATMKQLVTHGVARVKCATTLELLTACEAGVSEVLVSYPSNRVHARRVIEIARDFPDVGISATVENKEQIAQWKGTPVSLFIDINPGMDRTGIGISEHRQIVEMAQAIRRSGVDFAGLHSYEGHARQLDIEERKATLSPIYAQLRLLATTLGDAGVSVETIVTSGTPALPCILASSELSHGPFVHRISSGTIVYNDLSSNEQLPHEFGFQLGALVISTVISHPAPGVITCDAGHKAVSADAGVPNCIVLGHPELEPLKPSEEHMPIRVTGGVAVPPIGTVLYLVPKHVCTTINNFDQAMLVKEGRIVELADVTARGREAPVTAPVHDVD